MALTGLRIMKTTRTPVHRRRQHAPARGDVSDIAARAMHTVPVFEPLSHHVQHVAWKFRKFVEKQHPVMSERKLRRDEESLRPRWTGVRDL